MAAFVGSAAGVLASAAPVSRHSSDASCSHSPAKLLCSRFAGQAVKAVSFVSGKTLFEKSSSFAVRCDSEDGALASLKKIKIPGIEADSFTPEAENLNGRLAMIGFAGLLLIELKTGVGLIHFTSDLLIKPALELIGFAYTVYFILQKVLMKDQREQLQATVNKFIARVKGDTSES
uniref:Cyanobacterial aminoacyl-tRNA synthetase CAAD domain-containing protein n=1 Tax=Cyanoptyche gloeocystis TaxID=77922 RepID=A0A7S2JNW4_9EUKA|mmetsp:Transcript_23/g.59  ORF Transcript_23/g.59 Transcript_23/m.59 type:complete len:176 (+) Transcript_23:49-576(+)|eukprot:CAMPEP_0196662622 /NCGR_PEP_ID=MMETSP1086-20130531/49583_1 /TAXON_ID=77921 /ORGANISM="Cyanoptyche  gloeocystis , Strain SAG4.97" /LENGTH=175 /DNA_ID=CAMNT_0041998119 /DNA_START=49 /DNA_END=576 /DNA_ORIENTATION=+